MDSYFYAGRFYPHGAAPPSPELPFCFDSALPLVVEPPGATELPNDGAFRGYGEVAGQEVIAAGAGQGSAVMNAPGMMRADREQSRRREEEGSQRRQPGVVESSRGFRSYGEVPGQEVIAAGAGQGSVGMNGPGMMRAGPEQSRSREEEGSERRQSGAVESSRGFRHMMRERQRREKLSQSYADLYAMVAARSKVSLLLARRLCPLFLQTINSVCVRLSVCALIIESTGRQELDRAVGGDLHPRAQWRAGAAAAAERGAQGQDPRPRRAPAHRQGRLRGGRPRVGGRLHDRRAQAAQDHGRQGQRDPVDHVRRQAVDTDEHRDHGEQT
jgi:hypothetical protein